MAAAIAASLAAMAAPQHAQLRELFDTLKGTHGGPAFISGADLSGLRGRVLSMKENDSGSTRETDYASHCAWVMSQLEPSSAVKLPNVTQERVDDLVARSCVCRESGTCMSEQLSSSGV